MIQMTTVLEAKTSYLEARKAFKVAQANPIISDEEKLLQRDKMDDLADNTIESLAQTRGAGEHLDLDFIPPTESSEEEDVLEKNNIAQDETKDDKKEKDAQEKEDEKEKDAQDDEDEKDDVKKEMDAMKQKIAKMEYKEAKLKLAMRYGNLFTEGLREARINSFNSLNEPIKVLTARVDEAATLLNVGGQKLKVASIEDNLFNLQDLENNNNGTIDMGAKV